MTARRDRRRRAGIIGFVAGLLSLGVVAALAFVGVRSLLNSSSGQTAEAGAATPVQRFPYTPTGLIGVTDDDGVLSSAAAVIVAPDGTGGTIVSFAGSADSGSGTTGELRPLNGELAIGGPEAFSEAAERLTGLSFDVVELVDVERMEELIDPLGDLTVELVSSVIDASTRQEWESGSQVLSPADASALLAARAPGEPDWYFEPDRSAVWTSIADRVGAGIGSAEPVSSTTSVPTPTSMDEMIDRLFADRVVHRPLAFAPIDEERRSEELPTELAETMAAFDGDAVEVVAHDRAETQFVLASVAPGRLGAPLIAASIRIEIGYSDETVEGAGFTRADVGAEAVAVALFAGLNVLSVVDDPELGADEPTRVAVAEPDALEDAREIFPELYGEVEIDVADSRIEGIDAVVRPGRSWLEDLVDADEAAASDDDGDGAGDDGGAGPDTTTTVPDDGVSATEPATQPSVGDDGPDPAELEDELNAVVEESPIQFQSGSDVLEESAGPTLEELAALMTDAEGVSFVVEGHTDSDGNEGLNLEISEARAEAVIAELVERGVDEELLSAEGLGSSDPVLVDGVEDKAASRRVELQVIADPGARR